MIKFTTVVLSIFLCITGSYPSVALALPRVDKASYQNGQLKYVIPYNKNNQRHGLAKWYHANGQVSQEGPYEGGRAQGLWKTYHGNGQLHQERPHVDGRLHGMYKEYYASGAIKQAIPYVSHQRHGLAKWYSEDGKLTETIYYDMGNKSKLAKTESIDNKTETTTTSIQDPDGSSTVIIDGKNVKEQPLGIFDQIQIPSSTDEKTESKTTSVTNQDESTEVTENRPDSNSAPGDGKSKAPKEPKLLAEYTNPETGETTQKYQKPDGSYTTIKTDKEGNIIETTDTPARGSGAAMVSTKDPKTGVTTTITKDENGDYTYLESVAGKDENGNERILETDQFGNQTEIVKHQDGSTTITETDIYGNTREIKETTDGTATTRSRDIYGNTTETINKEDGTYTTVKQDRDGHTLETKSLNRDGSSTITDNKGRTTTIRETEKSGGLEIVKTDQRGNQTITKIDDNSKVVSEQEIRAVPKEPGEDYYNNVLKGKRDWEDLSEYEKLRYSQSERQIEEHERAEEKRQAQELARKKQEQEDRQWQEEQNRILEEKLAKIRAEQDEADKKALARREETELRRKRTEAKDKMNDLDEEIKAARARGDKKEQRRLETEHDQIHDSTAHLFEPTEKEKQAMEQKQNLRNKLVDDISAQARRLAAMRDAEDDVTQGLKEDITAGTKYVSIGSEMQQQTAKTTRMADREKNFADAKLEMIRAKLDHPSTTAAEKEILRDMMDLAALQKSGAERMLRDNKQLTAIGYSVDAALLLSGGIGNLAAATGSKVATKAIATSAARRVFAREIAKGASREAATKAAQTAGRQAVREAAETLATQTKRLADSTLGQVAQINAIPGARQFAGSSLAAQLAKHKLVQTMAGSAALGGTIDATIQLVRTGKVDLAQTARATFAGATLAGATSSFRRAFNAARGKTLIPNAPPISASSSTAISKAQPTSTVRTPSPTPKPTLPLPKTQAKQPTLTAKASKTPDKTLGRPPLRNIPKEFRAPKTQQQQRAAAWENLTPKQRQQYNKEVEGFIREAAQHGDRWAKRYIKDLDAGKLKNYFEPRMAENIHGLYSKGKMRLNPIDKNGNLRPPHELGSVALHEGVHKGIGGKKPMNEARAHFAQMSALHRHMQRNPGTTIKNPHIKKMYDNFVNAGKGKSRGEAGFAARRQLEKDFTQGKGSGEKGYAGGYKEKLNDYLNHTAKGDPTLTRQAYESYFRHMHGKLSSHKGGRAAKNMQDWDKAVNGLTQSERNKLMSDLFKLDQAGKTKDVVKAMDDFLVQAQRNAKKGMPSQYPAGRAVVPTTPTAYSPSAKVTPPPPPALAPLPGARPSANPFQTATHDPSKVASQKPADASLNPSTSNPIQQKVQKLEESITQKRETIQKLKDEAKLKEAAIAKIENRPAGPSNPKPLSPNQKKEISELENDLGLIRSEKNKAEVEKNALKEQRNELYTEHGLPVPGSKQRLDRLKIEGEVLERKGMIKLTDGFKLFDGVRKWKGSKTGKNKPPPKAVQVKTLEPGLKNPEVLRKWNNGEGVKERVWAKISKYERELNSDIYAKAQKQFNASDLRKNEKLNEMPDDWRDMPINLHIEILAKRPPGWTEVKKELLKDFKKLFGANKTLTINFQK